MKPTYAKASAGKMATGKNQTKGKSVVGKKSVCPIDPEQCNVAKDGQFDFFTKVISALNHPFYVINADDYSLVFANDAALQGRAMKNLTCYNISHKTNKPCNSAEHGCTLEIVKRTKQPTSLEHTHFDINGNPKNVQVYGYPIFDDKGKVVQMVEYCIDITEKKKITDRLVKNEAKLQALFDNMKSCVVIYEPVGKGEDFRIVEMNKATEKLEKINREYAVGKMVTEVFTGVKDFGLFKVFQRVNKTGVPENFPAAFYKDDRIASWRNNDVYKLATGEIVAIYEDITERKQLEEKIARNSRLNDAILENAPFGIYVVNEKGGIEYVNEAMIKISGTPKDHFLGLNMFTHEFYRAIGLSEKIKKAMSGEKFKMENVKYTSAFAGKTTVRNFIGLPVEGDGKKKVLMFVEDITSMVKAEEEIRRRNVELEKFNEIAVDRELRMVELKKKIKEMEKKNTNTNTNDGGNKAV